MDLFRFSLTGKRPTRAQTDHICRKLKGKLANLIALHGPLTFSKETPLRFSYVDQCILIPNFGTDTPFCSILKDSNFDTKCAYNIIWNSKFPNLKFDITCSTVRKARCPPKIKIFHWLIMWHMLPTASHLASRQIIPNSYRPFCPNVHEDSKHLFMLYPRAHEFWNEM